jgi:hypothetical protein
MLSQMTRSNFGKTAENRESHKYDSHREAIWRERAAINKVKSR